ncbi:MAG: hypothetical protein HFJ29_01645 [Clostridia bacterium]|nr:hypothetical protein [Clostridia bacterium]
MDDKGNITNIINKEIYEEKFSIWYNNPTAQPKETILMIKTITPSIKALIKGCSLKLVFGKKDNYLCIGARIIDIPDAPVFISKVQYSLQEHKDLVYALQEREFKISLINEMGNLLAWSKINISKEDSLKVLNWINEKTELYVGNYTKEIEYAHNCFCVSVEERYKYQFPEAYKIPIIEIDTIIGEWHSVENYSYTNEECYHFEISEPKDEGRTFEEEIASALVSVFPSNLYKGPKYKKGNAMKEMTDIFAHYQYGDFLIELKDVAIMGESGIHDRAKRISITQKHVKKAIEQLKGALGTFLGEQKIYTNQGEVIDVCRSKTPHCIILIPELIHDGDWSEIEKLLFETIKKTGTFFHILDLSEFIELLKASCGNPKIVDCNLMKRWELSMEKHTIHIKGAEN